MKKYNYFFAIFAFACFFAQGLYADPLEQIAKKMSKASIKLKNRDVAVLPFPYHDGRESKDSSIISERLVTKIAALKKLKVVERSLLEKVLSELKLEASGVTSQDSTKKLGNLLGVEAILTGTLIDLGENKIEINARLINAETGLVLAAESAEGERNWPSEGGAGAFAETSGKKEDMSTYFHSREYADPRFKDVPEHGLRNADNKQDAPVVFSNEEESNSFGGLGEEKITDSPVEFLNGALFYTADRLTPEFREMQQAWETLGSRQSELNVAKFADMRKIFRDLGKEKYSLLSQLYLAEANLRIERFDEAIREAKPLARLERFPKLRAHALYVVARSFDGLGKRGIASNLYREIVRNYPFESRLVRASGNRIRNTRR